MINIDHHNVLNRACPSFLSSSQLRMDGIFESFLKEATDIKPIASMMAGSFAYRVGTVLSSAFLPRIFSPIVGLACEAITFEGTQRIFTGTPKENFAQSCRNSFFNFGVLKGMGHLLRSQNLILQHFSQDLSMVTANQATSFLGFTSRPEGNFLDQILQAEVVNNQLVMGNCLARSFIGHRVLFLEEGVERDFRSSSEKFSVDIQRLIPFSAMENVRVENTREGKFISESLGNYENTHYVSDLLPHFDTAYRAVLESMKEGHLAYEEGQIRLHQVLKENWLERQETEGAEVSRYRLGDSNALARTRISLPTWIKEYLEEHPESRDWQVVRVEVEDPDASNDFRFLHFISTMFEMGLGMDRGALTTSRSIVIFPHQIYREAALHLHRNPSIHRVPVDRYVSMKEMESFRRRNDEFVDEWPLQLGRRSMRVHGLVLSSFVLAEHDNVHPLYLELFGRDFREDIFDIYLVTQQAQRALRMNVTIDLLAPISEGLVASPEGMGREDYRAVLQGVRGFLEGYDSSGRFPSMLAQGLRERFQDRHPRHSLVDQASQQVF